MFAFSISDVLWTVLGAAVIIGLAVLAKHLEPHWVAKDANSFTCKVQPLDARGGIAGRWRDARVTVRDHRLQLMVRATGIGPTSMVSDHAVIGRSDDPPSRREVFVLDGEPMWALRIPASSRAVARLEALRTDG